MAADAAAAGIAGAMSGASLGQLMATEGPIVKIVILEVDGTVVEREVDMSPKINKVRRGAEIEFTCRWHLNTLLLRVVPDVAQRYSACAIPLFLFHRLLRSWAEQLLSLDSGPSWMLWCLPYALPAQGTSPTLTSCSHLCMRQEQS